MTRSPKRGTLAHMAQSKLPVEDLREQVLDLSPVQRLALATELFDSVEGADPAWDEEFARELRRRSDAYRSGASPGVPAVQVHAEARARLRARHTP